MSLTDSKCKAAKPLERQYKLADDRGLSLLVQPSGTKSWVHRYYFDGKQRDETLGRYPDVSLALARKRRDVARVLLAEGRDPKAPEGEAEVPRPADRRRLFRNVAEEWFESRKRPTLEPRTAERQWARLLNLFPELGEKDVGEIEAADVLRALQAIEGRGAVYTARRIRGMAEAVFDYAEIPYGVPRNPASPRLLQNLRPVPMARNQPSLPFARLPEFFEKLRFERVAQAQDDTRTRLAVELILHTALRTSELRAGRWEQIRGDEWHIPAAQMKAVNGVRRDHIVPLSPRAQEILRQLRPLARKSELIFPGLRPGRSMSENTMGNWMKARGYQDVATIHGFRSTFSTHAHESGLWESEHIELQLAHVDRDKVRGIYNKAVHLEPRKRMMAWWSQELARQEKAGILGDLL